MPHRRAEAAWQGDLPHGKGRMKLGSGGLEFPYSFQTRMGDEPGSNPEELIGAALAGCFSMALALGLTEAGAVSKDIRTDATVNFEKTGNGWTITGIDLVTEVSATDISEEKFQAVAAETKKQCPVARALTGVEVRLDARLNAT